MQRAQAVFFLLLSVVLQGARGQAVETLNLSHDLVPLGIAGSNMAPNSPELDSRPLFEAGIEYARDNGIGAITVDRGNYYFLSQHSDYQHVYLEAVDNLVIDLQNSNLYFAHGNVIAIECVNCSAVTFTRFTIDYLQLPFTQVRVTGVDAAKRTVTFERIGGYALPSDLNGVNWTDSVNDGFFCFAFRNGRPLRQTGRMEVGAPREGNSLQIVSKDPWTTSSELEAIQPGDTLALTFRAGLGAITLFHSDHVSVNNLAVYASGFAGVFADRSSNIVMDRVQITPRPGTDRLISTNGDGMHLARSGPDNRVTNNTIRRTCDDAMGIDGQWYAFVKAPGPGARVVVVRRWDSPLPVGEAFDFVNITDATLSGSATIVAVDPPPARQTYRDGELITLTLDRTIPGLQAGFGVTPSDPKRRGAGTVFRGNLVQEIVFSRAIYLAGVADVSVTDNLVRNINNAGVLIEQDEALSYNYKTGPSSRLTIRNNVIDGAFGFGGPTSGILDGGGAVNVVAYDWYWGWVSTSSLSDISVIGNFVTNSIRTGIRIQNVNGGEVTGNTIRNYATDPDSYLWYLPYCCESLDQVQAEFRQPIVIADSVGVKSAENITDGPVVHHVSAAGGGARLAPGALAAAYGEGLAAETVSGAPPWPTSLGGVSVNVTDSAGVSRPAGLVFVSPTQIAYQVPPDTAEGVATVSIGGNASATLIASVAPGFFSLGESDDAVVADLGEDESGFIRRLYGTGVRGRGSLSGVVAEVGGVPAEVLFAGPAALSDGIDQVDLVVPRSLAGAGSVSVVVTVDGQTAKPVTIWMK